MPPETDPNAPQTRPASGPHEDGIRSAIQVAVAQVVALVVAVGFAVVRPYVPAEAVEKVAGAQAGMEFLVVCALVYWLASWSNRRRTEFYRETGEIQKSAARLL